MEKTLEKELKCFNDNLPKLLSTARNKYVLVHGDEIVETFESKEDAIKAGYERVGIVPFLVKQVKELEDTYNFTSTLI